MRLLLQTAVCLGFCACGSVVTLPDAGFVPLACYEQLDAGVFVDGFPSPIPGCAAPAPLAGVFDLADAGWWPRGGLLVVPETAAGTPLQVVLAFHGAGGSGAEVRDQFQLEALADGGAIFIYPNASAGTWDVGPDSRDARRVDGLLQSLSTSYCIDPRRVFATGWSAGAVFTLYLGCSAPGTFRAVGTVAGTDDRFDSRCCTQPLSAILIHGALDPAIRLSEGQLALNRLRERDGCSGVTAMPDGPNCQEYPGCISGDALDWCQWSGFHDPPSWAGSEFWRFFSALP